MRYKKVSINNLFFKNVESVALAGRCPLKGLCDITWLYRSSRNISKLTTVVWSKGDHKVLCRINRIGTYFLDPRVLSKIFKDSVRNIWKIKVSTVSVIFVLD